MTVSAIFVLAGVMIVLAAMPSASVALVVARSAQRGVWSGCAVAVGIVIGDLVFVALALSGMSVLAETMGAFFAVMRFAAGAYLIWMGIALLRSIRRAPMDVPDRVGSKLIGSFAAGLVLTLGDVKAILFYSSLFPVFLDLSAVDWRVASTVAAITVISVGSVKVIYALCARHVALRFIHSRSTQVARGVAGTTLIGTGVVLLTKP